MKSGNARLLKTVISVSHLLIRPFSERRAKATSLKKDYCQRGRLRMEMSMQIT